MGMLDYGQTEERKREGFKSHVKEVDGHWLWLGKTNMWGIPIIRHGDEVRTAYIVGLLLFRNIRIAGGYIKTCDYELCVHPKHYSYDKPDVKQPKRVKSTVSSGGLKPVSKKSNLKPKSERIKYVPMTREEKLERRRHKYYADKGIAPEDMPPPPYRIPDEFRTAASPHCPLGRPPNDLCKNDHDQKIYRKRHKNGKPYCSKCSAETSAKWKADNRERYRQLQRNWYEKNKKGVEVC